MVEVKGEARRGGGDGGSGWWPVMNECGAAGVGVGRRERGQAGVRETDTRAHAAHPPVRTKWSPRADASTYPLAYRLTWAPTALNTTRATPVRLDSQPT